jgi:hypothetical protein
MGGLLSIISTENHKKGIDIVLNFEDCEPKGEEEKAIYDEVSAVLAKGPSILDDLTNYSGCEEYIRKAITTPGPETEEKAWEMVLPAVDKLKEFYDFSLELEDCFPKLLIQLCTGSVTDNIKDQEALAKLLADVFDFVLRFDDAKMVNPAIQNDFSYYRRTLNRMKLSKKDMNLTIKDELANRMSLFFAYPTPMMKVLSDTSASFLSKGASVSKESVNEALAVMANVCQHMVEIGTFSDDNLNLYCLRAMTGAIILFDHVCDAGAFHKKTPINIRGAIASLKSYSSAGGLLNALRFTTVHLNDADTPSSIKQLLA